MAESAELDELDIPGFLSRYEEVFGARDLEAVDVEKYISHRPAESFGDRSHAGDSEVSVGSVAEVGSIREQGCRVTLEGLDGVTVHDIDTGGGLEGDVLRWVPGGHALAVGLVIAGLVIAGLVITTGFVIAAIMTLCADFDGSASDSTRLATGCGCDTDGGPTLDLNVERV